MSKNPVTQLNEDIILESILRSSTDMAIAATDLDFHILYYNPVAEKLFGYRAEEVIGKTVMEMYTKENVEPSRFEKAIETVLKEGEYRYTLEQEKENGIRYIESRVSGILDKQNHLIGFVLMSRDVTKRKQAEEKIIRISSEWETTFNSINDLVSIHDKDFNIIRVNQAFCDFFKKKDDELIGRKCYEVVHGSNKPWSNCPVKQTIETEEPVTQEFFEPEMGIYLQVSTSPIFDETGEIIRTVHIAKDITNRKKVENAFKTAKDELEEKIQKRTADLKSAVNFLQKEITVRKKIEEELRKAEKKRRIHAKELAESNVALKVLLKQREQDQKEFENNILSNIKHLIMPYIDKLKKNRAMSDELVYLNSIESNLKEIVSPFSANLSFRNLNFTPKEIMIADLIKDGKQDKDIMEMLNISLDTIKTHRRNIRKKLGIYNQKVNLRTKLLSFN